MLPVPATSLFKVEDQMNATTFSEYLEKGYYRNDGIQRWGAMRVVSMPETLAKLGACKLVVCRNRTLKMMK